MDRCSFLCIFLPDCLGFLTAWWLSLKNEHIKSGREMIAFYDPVWKNHTASLPLFSLAHHCSRVGNINPTSWKKMCQIHLKKKKACAMGDIVAVTFGKYVCTLHKIVLSTTNGILEWSVCYRYNYTIIIVNALLSRK